MGGGLGLLVPPLASTLLGSVEKARSGVAAGVLNSTRQTGSVLGVALFGSLIGQENAFLLGARANDLCVVACWGSGRDHNWRTHKEIRPCPDSAALVWSPTADGASHEDGRPHKTAVLGRTGRMSRSRGRQDMPSEFCQQLGAFLFHQLCASVTSA